MRKSFLLLLGCFALLALGVAGCGDDKSDSGTTATASDSTTESSASTDSGSGDSAAVKIKDIKFEPHDINVDVGETVVWTNDDSVAHNVTATDGADFASETLNQGDTYEYKATAPGTIKYECTIHPGQTGTIKVSS